MYIAFCISVYANSISCSNFSVGETGEIQPLYG